MQPFRKCGHLVYMSDEEWLALIQTIGPKLYRFFLSESTSSRAEELVQDVFMRLWAKIQSASFKQDLGNVEAFTWVIALNVRREHRRNLRPVSASIEEIDVSQFDVLMSESQIESDIEGMKKAIHHLDEPERTVLQLILSDMKISEIAKIMEMPEGTIKSHIHRAKDNVRNTMRKWGLL